MIDIPGLGIKDIIDGLGNFVKWYDARRRKKHKEIWRNANLSNVYAWIVQYYNLSKLPMIQYKNSTSKNYYPLLALLNWEDSASKKIDMNFENSKLEFNPSRSQKKFYDFFYDLKNFKDFDLDVFNLTSIKNLESSIKLNFNLGKFSHSVMCQYILEDELINLLNDFEYFDKDKFSLRNSVASNYTEIQSFFKNNVTRIGLCTLILLKKDQNHYIPMVKKRGKYSMINQDLFDPISSCVFEVATAPKADFELTHTLFREIYEELFGQEELTESIPHLNPHYFYELDGIKDLNRIMQEGNAKFEITGLCVDLIRMVPEITAVLIVQDPEYFQKYYNINDSTSDRFVLNDEFNPHSSNWEIPISITDASKYLEFEVLSDPDGNESNIGFDPMKWTLPGGYSYYQGINYVINKGLLI